MHQKNYKSNLHALVEPQKNLKPFKNETPMHQVVAPHINKTTQNINLNF
jgi:hypothetical protein